MNIEQRLQAASRELNQVSRRVAPPTLVTERTIRNGLLAFSAAFAVVIAVVGIPLMLGNLTQAPSADRFVGAGGTSTTTMCLRPETTMVLSDGGLEQDLGRQGQISATFALRNDIDIVAFLNDEGPGSDHDTGEHEKLLAEVESWVEVASVTYFDKDEAWAEYQQIFEGEEELLDIDPAILPATIRIELADRESSDLVLNLLSQSPLVDNAVSKYDIQSPEEPGVASDEGAADEPDCIDTVSTLAPTTTSDPDCEASDLYPPTTIGYTDDDSDPRDLTEPVRDKLTRIAEAASLCDASALSELAHPDIATVFGAGSEPEGLSAWEVDDERFEIIVNLLNMTHDIVEMENGERLFVWPAAFKYDTWDEIPDHLVDELLRIYTQEELDGIALFGSYAGWRAGITESGEWLFFVAGD